VTTQGQEQEVIWVLRGRFEYIFRDPDLYMRSRPMIGDFCTVTTNPPTHTDKGQ